jgi:hypothetical protein
LLFLCKALAPVIPGNVSTRNPKSCRTQDDSRSRELDAGAQESQAGLTQELTSIACSSLDQTLPEPMAERSALLAGSVSLDGLLFVPPDHAEIR